MATKAPRHKDSPGIKIFEKFLVYLGVFVSWWQKEFQPENNPRT